jgi:ABC-type oligopeptide transport system substrate-binding subunit
MLRRLAINWTIRPFDDVRVRQAFSLALDRRAIVHEVYLDTWQPTIHLVPEGMPGYNPDLTDAVGRRGKDALTPDVASARALLNAYAAEKCGGAWRKCPTVTLNGYLGSTITTRLVTSLAAQWRHAFPDYPILTQTISPSGECPQCILKRLPTITSGWDMDYPDPQDFVSVLWTTHSEANLSQVSLPEADALLAQADSTTDLAVRIPLYQLAEQLLINQGATIPLAQAMAWNAVRSRVVDWQVAPTHVISLFVWQKTYLKR